MPFNPPPPPDKPFKVRMDSAGRVLLPAALRKKLGVQPGDALIIKVTEPGHAEAWTIDWGIRRAQAIAREIVPEGVSLVDELIAERRAENAKDEAEWAESNRLRVLRERRSDE